MKLLFFVVFKLIRPFRIDITSCLKPVNNLELKSKRKKEKGRRETNHATITTF